MKASPLFSSLPVLCIGLCLPVLLTGCTVIDTGFAKQSDLIRVKNNQNEWNRKQEDELQKLQNKQGEMNKQLEALQQTLKQMRADKERPRTETKTIVEIETAKETPSQPPVPDAGATQQPVGEQELFRQCKEAYIQQRDYGKTITLSEQYLQQFPDATGAPEVLLCMTYACYSQQNYTKTLDICNRFATAYPASPFLARIYHTKANSESLLNKKTEALETIRNLRSAFPDYEDKDKVDGLYNTLLLNNKR
jgi:TolA-binding protein